MKTLKNFLTVVLIGTTSLIGCTNSNQGIGNEASTNSEIENTEIDVTGVYSGTDNVGMTSTIILRDGGSLIIQASVGDGTPNYGTWNGSADRLSLYQTDDFGNEQLIADARVTKNGLQIIGGQFYSRQ